MKAPRRVSFFVWTTTWGDILNGDYLRIRGIPIVDRCCLCWYSGESVACSLLGSFSVMEFFNYGVLHLDFSVLLGFYPIMLLIYWQYGETRWESTLQKFGFVFVWLELIRLVFSFYVQVFKTPLFLTFYHFFKVQVYFSTLLAKKFQQKVK